MRCNVFSAIALLALSCVCHAANSGAAVTLHSGYFDDFLMIAADAESGQLSGYYNDGKCRLYFQGPLVPGESYQRKELGEVYTPTAWSLSSKAASFSMQIYSRAKQGFNDQITIESGVGHPKKCRSSISMDRASHVSNSFVGVRVVRKRNAPLYQRQQTEKGPAMINDRKTKAPKVYTGVWLSKSYWKNEPAGYRYISWYETQGTPRSAFIREQDLFPLLPQNK
jgi:hypothetical protein